METPILRIGGWLFSTIFVISAPVSGYFLFQLYLTARASESWPSVPGQVLKAQVATTSSGRYFADVSYTYSVSDQPYLGHRIRASDGESNIPDAAAQKLQGLAPGQPVPVFYNPADPSQSLLQPGVGYQEYALLFVPVLILALGIAGFVRLWQTRD